MEKVYRLMHNNIERGPYSIDELLQQKIQPWDLIWEEGKNKWQFAAQIAELNEPQSARNFNHETFQNASESTPESRMTSSRDPAKGADHFLTDKEEFELRAQELKRDVTMYSTSYHSMPLEGRSRTGTRASQRPFDKIDLVVHKKERSKYHSEFLLACLVFFLFIYGWYKGAISNREAQNEDIAARPLIIPSSTELPKETPIPNNTVAFQAPIPVVSEEPSPTPIKKQKAAVKKPTKTSVSKKKEEEPAQPVPQTTVSVIEPPGVETPAQEPVQVKETPIAVVEKKKTFGQAIKGIFKKKNKKLDTAMGD